MLLTITSPAVQSAVQVADLLKVPHHLAFGGLMPLESSRCNRLASQVQGHTLDNKNWVCLCNDLQPLSILGVHHSPTHCVGIRISPGEPAAGAGPLPPRALLALLYHLRNVLLH